MNVTRIKNNFQREKVHPWNLYKDTIQVDLSKPKFLIAKENRTVLIAKKIDLPVKRSSFFRI